MDLHLRAVEATEEERAAVDAVLGAPESGWHGGEFVAERDGRLAWGGAALRARRPLLLPALQALQSRVGWISEGGLNHVCARLGVPPAEAWGVASFYALLATSPRPKRVLHVCDDVACRARGAERLAAELERVAGPPLGGHGADPTAADAGWARSPCLGLCDHAPAGFVTQAGEQPVERLVEDLTPSRALELLRGGVAGPGAPAFDVPQRGQPGLRLLARVGVVDPTSLDDYRAHGGYRALRMALELGPERVLSEVVHSRLLGRGGAAFPVGRKWEAVARNPRRPHYLVCNADESEPGTFKDRVLMDGDPYAIVEAMTIAAYATGCELGFIYVRAEYPLAYERLRGAVEQARARGLLGDSILGRPFRFDIQVRRGAGAYICGEETAIFNSIEGYRGEPRNKPPFPADVGLFGQPTVVNNVETLANVPWIVLEGGAAFAAGNGTEHSTGTKLFCLSGCVERPGVYEVPFGTTLGELLALAGGPPAGRRLKAVLLGGAAGAFVGPDAQSLALTFEGTRAAGAALGSGVVLVLDDTVDLKDILLRIAAFFRDESCGQCVPCRVGTVRQEEALRRIVEGKTIGTVEDEVALLDEIGRAMRDASICGLGQTAYAAIESAVRRLDVFGTGRAS